VTGRGWTARQPDGTPVEELPLQPRTITVLRAGGVLTLGQLRAMGDHELLLLRLRSKLLADIRFLVPMPAGSRAGVAGREATIAGRLFTVGVVYRPRPGVRGHRPRRLLAYDPDGPLPGGRVEVAVLPSANKRAMAGAVWAAWAGEEVEG